VGGRGGRVEFVCGPLFKNMGQAGGYSYGGGRGEILI